MGNLRFLHFTQNETYYIKLCVFLCIRCDCFLILICMNTVKPVMYNHPMGPQNGLV